ncbi:phosphoribosyl-ATP diphosphatase [Candidatus Parvarchaeota archaeon]|nr:phosphoribosyl-ATP diphosphatase [Candidatus Parvarchaeota archaeon]
MAAGKKGAINSGRASSLMPLIVQDRQTKQVLSLVWANKEAVAKIKETGFLWRYSRQFGKVMRKGETSGNVQAVKMLLEDCDSDALLAVVDQMGNCACHKGGWTCFEAKKGREWGFFDELIGVIRERKEKPIAGSYTSKLLADKKEIGNKLREEAAELEEAVLVKEDREVAWEAADLLYFTLVALESRGIDIQKVIEELKRRKK